MPQLVRDLRYCAHCEHGVEMSLSMSLQRSSVSASIAQSCHLIPGPYRVRISGCTHTSDPLSHCDNHRLSPITTLAHMSMVHFDSEKRRSPRANDFELLSLRTGAHAANDVGPYGLDGGKLPDV